MTNPTNKTIGTNVERSVQPSPPRTERKVKSPKMYGATYVNSIATPPRGGAGSPRLSPSRLSPGLLAGHFAGGKWSEPPSPTTLPKPPHQWTRFTLASNCSSNQHMDINNHLMMLLKVQA